MSLINKFKRNAGTVSTYAYMVATSLLVLKDIAGFVAGQSPTMLLVATDLIAAAGFYFSAYQYQFIENKPGVLKRAGVGILVASIALMAGGWRGTASDISFWLQAASMLPTAFAGVCFLTDRKNLGAMPELLSRPFWIIASAMQMDFGRVIAAVLCAVGDIGVLASKSVANEAIEPRSKP